MTARQLWSATDVACALGITRQSLWQAVREGRVPGPDYVVGVSTSRPTAAWRPATVQRWADRAGRALRDVSPLD